MRFRPSFHLVTLMGGLITFLIGVLILLVVLYVVKLVLGYLELDPPLRKIVMLIVAIIAIIVLIGLLANVFGGGPRIIW